MGIARGALRFLLEEGLRQPWDGNLLTLGRQATTISGAQLEAAADAVGYRLRSSAGAIGDLLGDGRKTDDTAFFRAIGFDSVTVMDASSYEGADIIFDLNDRSIPVDLKDRYDVCLDGGTLEHVFDVAQALRNCCAMTRIGGRIVHISPMSNCADHGFYSFSPTLFADFYSANDFEVRSIVTAQFDKDPVSDEWSYQPYRPGSLGALGQLPPGVHFLLVCAKRTAESRCDINPQQAYYRDVAWRAGTLV